MNVVDSSCWLEYFAGTDRAKEFRSPIEDSEQLLVPTVILYEVYKKICLEADEGKALRAIAHMRCARILDIDSAIALSAARLSIQHKLPMVDALILACTRSAGATLHTQDAHFEPLDGVKYYRK